MKARPAIGILEEAAALGITLRVERGDIRFRPREAMTPELEESIRASRGELLELLAAAVPPPELSCWNCHGTRYFARVERLTWICAKCHPPAEPDVMVWHEVAGAPS